MISFSKVNFSYGDFALRDITWQVQKAEFWAVLGANGSGKSTLLKVLSRFLPIASGSINVLEKNLANYSNKALAQTIAVLSQEQQYDIEFSAAEVVMMGRAPYLGWFQNPGTHDYDIIEHAMKKTDCWSLAKKPMHTLSGGERMRVWLAKVLAQQTQIILLDEPSTYLDFKHQLEFSQLLSELHREQHLTLVAVLHDLNWVNQLAQKVLLLKSGSVIAQGAKQDVLKNHLLADAFDLSPAQMQGLIAPSGFHLTQK